MRCHVALWMANHGTFWASGTGMKIKWLQRVWCIKIFPKVGDRCPHLMFAVGVFIQTLGDSWSDLTAQVCPVYNGVWWTQAFSQKWKAWGTFPTQSLLGWLLNTRTIERKHRKEMFYSWLHCMQIIMIIINLAYIGPTAGHSPPLTMREHTNKQ